MTGPRDGEWTAGPGDGGAALAAFLRSKLEGCSWRDVKRLVETGKVTVGASREADPGRRLRPGDIVSLRMAAPKAREAAPHAPVRIVFEDTHLVVIDKPAGVSSVPFGLKSGGAAPRGPAPREEGSAMDLVRDLWRREGRRSSPLLMVHRIDKPTSGVLVYARTALAERELFERFRAHTIERTYVLVANGVVETGTIDRVMIKDRGDGLRWVASPGREDQGKRAVTHLRALEALRGATLCTAKLETGRTHQIRVHLAAGGHPLVGEPVYARDAEAAGEPLVQAPRMLLHAATLGLPHPVTGQPLSFRAPLPADFRAVLQTLGWSGEEPRTG